MANLRIREIVIESADATIRLRGAYPMYIVIEETSLPGNVPIVGPAGGRDEIHALAQTVLTCFCGAKAPDTHQDLPWIVDVLRRIASDATAAVKNAADLNEGPEHEGTR